MQLGDATMGKSDGIITVITKGKNKYWTLSVLGNRKINKTFDTASEAREFARYLERPKEL